MSSGRRRNRKRATLFTEPVMAAISCPHCSQSFEVPDDTPAKSVRCPHCHQSLAPGNAAMASGEPPERPASTPDGDDALPRERRDIAKKSSPLGPILIVGAVVVLVLCVCAAPALLFLGGFSFFAVARQEAIQEAEAVRVAEKNVVVDEIWPRSMARFSNSKDSPRESPRPPTPLPRKGCY